MFPVSVFFDDILTVITEVPTLSGSPLLLSGKGTFNDLAITYSSLTVTRDSELDLQVTGGSVTFSPSSDPYQPDNWPYHYANAELNASGAFADMSVDLPVEMSYWDDASTNLFDRGPFPLDTGIQLTQDLLPRDTIPVPGIRWFQWEGLPIYFISTEQTFTDADGFELGGTTVPFHYHAFRLNDFENPGPRAFNDGYLYNPSGIVFDGTPFISSSGFQGRIVNTGGTYCPAFPQGFEISFSTGTFVIVDSRLSPEESGLEDVEIDVEYDSAACSGDDSVVTQSHSLPLASIGADRSLYAFGDSGPHTYAWNTYLIEDITHCQFYQPGYMVREDTPTSHEDDVDEYLLSPWDSEADDLYYYGTSDFLAGEGLYAGLNLLRSDLDGITTDVDIDSSPSNPLTLALNEGSKLYVRRCGVSGTLDAGTIGVSLDIYPDFTRCPDHPYYKIYMETFGQAFLSNDPTGLDSKIDGYIDIPFPSLIQFPYENMVLNGCGDFEGGTIPEDEREIERTLSHWAARLRIQTFSFDQKTPTSPEDDRTLWISSVNPITHLTENVVMQINLLPCGDIGGSRINEPVSAQFDGFEVTVQDIYLTRHDPGRPIGFYNVIGEVHFPFFGSSSFHSIVKSSVAFIQNGQPYFDTLDPDDDDNGFPDSWSPDETQLDAQVLEYSKEELVRVEKLFANLIQLEYDLEYNRGGKQFFSPETKGQNLIVIDVESSVQYLDAERTRVKFGFEFDAVPKLDLASMMELLPEEMQDSFFSSVRDDLDDAGESLDGDITEEMRPEMRELVTPVVEAFVEKFRQDLAEKDPSEPFETFRDNWVGVNLPDLIDDLELETKLRSPLNPVYDKVKTILDTLKAIKDAMNFNLVEELEGLTGFASQFLEFTLQGMSMQSGRDPNEIVERLESAREWIHDALDDHIVPALTIADESLDEDDMNDIFDPAEITSVENSIQTVLEPLLKSLNRFEVETLHEEEITSYVLNQLLNSPMYSQLNAEVMSELYPIKDQLLELTQQVLDAVNRIVMVYIEEAAGWTDSSQVSFNDVMDLAGASLDGYAIIAGDVLEKLHIDLEAYLSIPDEMEFKGYLDLSRYQISNDGKNCLANLDGEEVLDIRIGAKDIDFSLSGSSLGAKKIEVALMLLDGKLANVGGEITTKGTLDFESVKFKDLGFGVAVGAIENHIWAMGTAVFDDYSLQGGIFLGTSCDMEPLERLDPTVAELLDIEEMRGIYAGVQGSFTIWDYSCLLKVGAGAGVSVWYFAEGPTWGGRLVGAVYGTAVCLIHVRGQLEIIGGRSGDVYYFNGNAWVAGGIGFCSPAEWNKISDVWEDDWCYTCVAYIDLTYKNDDWEVDYSADCE